MLDKCASPRIAIGRRIVRLAAVIVVTVASGSPSAGAASNGRIAFEVPPDSTPSLGTINPDGSGTQAIPGVPTSSANPAWSGDGERLAFTSTASGRTQVYTINADGTGLRKITNDPVAATDPTWSPDGHQLAFSSWRNGLPDVWLVNLDTLALTRLTGNAGINQQPRWSPDGRLIAFVSNRTGRFQIFTMAPDGTGQQAITSRPGDNTDPAWSPRGAQIAYTNTLNSRQIYAIGRTGTGDQQLTRGDGLDQFPAWSPDGTKIAFTRDFGVWVMPSNGESANAFATELAFSGVDPVWAPQPPPVAQQEIGTVTATAPGATTQPITSTTPLATGTVVDATAGSLVVSFKPLVDPLRAPPSTALVQHTAFAISDRTKQHVTLSLASPPPCGPRTAVVARPNGRVVVKGSGVRTKTHHTAVDVTDPNYEVLDNCRGTTVTVTKGAVRVTVLNKHLPTTVTLRSGRRSERIVLNRGRRPVVRVAAGGSLFVSARG